MSQLHVLYDLRCPPDILLCGEEILCRPNDICQRLRAQFLSVSQILDKAGVFFVSAHKLRHQRDLYLEFDRRLSVTGFVGHDFMYDGFDVLTHKLTLSPSFLARGHTLLIEPRFSVDLLLGPALS